MVISKRVTAHLGVITVIFLSMFIISCGSSTTSSSSSSSSSTTSLEGLASCTAQSGSSVICGTVYAVDGVTPVANATVSLVTSSSSVSTLKGLFYGEAGHLTANTSDCMTDEVGQFACQVDNCSGTATFSISSDLFGSNLEFSADCTVDSVTNVPTTTTTATATETSGGSNWLVIPGSYDGVQLLLSQIKGCTLTGDDTYPSSLRGSSDCEDKGLYVLESSEVVTTLTGGNLSNYEAIFVNCSADYSSSEGVNDAISSYVSGGGNMYFSDLSDSWFSEVFTTQVVFPSSNKNSTSSGTISDATVSNSGLQTFLGSSTIEIVFDLSVWTAMESVASTWTTYIEADISSLASSLTGTRPITVGGPVDNGCAFYTSYHVEGASTGAAQENALKYLVLNKMGDCD